MLKTMTLDNKRSGLLVIETEDNWYLGSMEVISDQKVKVRTHRVGNPVILDVTDIEEVTPAELHPCVEFA